MPCYGQLSPTMHLNLPILHAPQVGPDWFRLMGVRYTGVVAVDPIETKFGCFLQVAVESRTGV